MEEQISRDWEERGYHIGKTEYWHGSRGIYNGRYKSNSLFFLDKMVVILQTAFQMQFRELLILFSIKMSRMFGPNVTVNSNPALI